MPPPAVALHGQHPFLLENGFHGLLGMTINQQLDAAGEERGGDFLFLEGQQAGLAGDGGELNQFVDAALGIGQLESKGAAGNFYGANKLANIEFCKYHKQAATKHDKHRWYVEEHLSAGAQQNGCGDDAECADQANQGCEIQRGLLGCVATGCTAMIARIRAIAAILRGMAKIANAD